MGQAGPRRRRLFRLVAALLAVVSALALGEGAVRVVGVTSEPRRHFRPGIYAPDPALGWSLVLSYRGAHVEYDFAAATTTNALGFRGPEWDARRREAAMRVLVLGDSCTFGRGVDDESAFPAQLEALLRARGLDAAVFNAGVPGYDTVQEDALLERLLPVVRPHVVVVAWLPNDVLERSTDARQQVQVLDGQLVEDVERYREWRGQVEHSGLHASALYRFLRVRLKLLKDSFGARRSAWDVDLGPDALAYSQEPLGRIAARTRATGARVVLALVPREEELAPGASAGHHDLMERFGREQAMTVVNLARLWRERGGPLEALYLPRDTVHFTREGYAAVARDLAAACAP